MLRAIAAIVAAAAMAAAATPAAAQQQDRDCGWGAGNRAVVPAYPDLGARYWSLFMALPPGGEVILRGTYPHARYMSFNVYDAALQPTDGLADVDIAPDPGSTNPFEVGAARDALARSYTVRIVSGPRPAVREPNTLYVNLAGQPNPVVALLYRVYLPDAGRDPSGDAGQPDISLKLPTGQVVEQSLRCQQPSDTNGAAHAQFADGDSAGVNPDDPGAEDPIRWEAFFNYAQAFTYPIGSGPAAALRSVLPRDKLGGFLSNTDNAYTIAFASRGKGPVLVLEGRAPTTPETMDGRTVMEGGDLRYWSLCENEFASEAVIDCAFDEQVVTDKRGRYKLVMSTPADRPANARPECGVNWIRWGTQPTGLLILRHMLPSPDFTHAIQRVSELGTERDVMGDYLPVGTHTTRAAFEAGGTKKCRAGRG